MKNVLEPDKGELAIVTVCLSAVLEQQSDCSIVDQQDDMEVTYMFYISGRSTAVHGVDYEQDFVSSFEITDDFVGNFSACLNVTIIGNNKFDGNRKVVFLLTENGNDTLQYEASFMVNILEDDGKYTRIYCHACIIILTDKNNACVAVTGRKRTLVPKGSYVLVISQV